MGATLKGRSQKGGNFLVGGTWGRRRRRMRAQKGGARIYLFDFLSFWKVKVFWVMDSQHCILFSSWRGLFGERSQQYVDFYFVQKYKLKKNHYHHEVRTLKHCGHKPWGPTFFKMGTRWGPNFQWNGDQMGTLASRMGTQKAHVCKIDWNKVIWWNKAFKGGKMFFTRTVKLAWETQVLVVLLQVIT